MRPHPTPSSSVVFIDPLVCAPFREAPPYHFKAMVRIRGGMEGAAQAIRTAFREMDPDLLVPDVESLEGTLREQSRETRILGMLFSLFASVGVFLSALGIYSVTAYAASRRTREIGIRMALGATAEDIARLILRSGVTQLAAALMTSIARKFSHFMELHCGRESRRGPAASGVLRNARNVSIGISRTIRLMRVPLDSEAR